MSDQQTSHGGPAGDSAARADPSRADVEPASTAQAATADAPQPAGGVLGTGTPVVVLALAVAFLAAAGTGFLWWQYRHFYLALNEADIETASALERIRAAARALEDELVAVAGDAEPMREDIDALERRVDSIPSRLGELERRLNAVQGLSTDARTHWMTSEAEYYLALANTELDLAGHWGNATTALGLADERLRELGNPAFGPVRALIAEELQALRAARLPDVEGLSYSLGRLAERVPELPMRGDSPQSFSDRSGPADAEPGLGRLWSTLRGAVTSIVSVERRTEPVEPALTAGARMLTQRQLMLELTIARLALIRGHAEAFGESLAAATALLERDFDPAAAPVESAIQLLREMAALDIAPAAPDISRSLNLLRRLTAGDI